MVTTRIITDLTSEPVTAADAKLYAKITGTADDTIISSILLPAARSAIEKYCACTMREKTLEASWDAPLQDWTFELPYGPVISVVSVRKILQNGTEESLVLNTDYYVIGDKVKINQIWSTSIIAGIKIRYKAGYGDIATEPLPAQLKEAILAQFAYNYEFRTGGDRVSTTAKEKAAPFRRSLWM